MQGPDDYDPYAAPQSPVAASPITAADEGPRRVGGWMRTLAALLGSLPFAS
jgi:hypothetical protein